MGNSIENGNCSEEDYIIKETHWCIDSVSIPIKKAVTSPNVPPPPPIVVSEDEKKKKKKSKPKATLKRKGTLYIYKQVKKKKG